MAGPNTLSAAPPLNRPETTPRSPISAARSPVSEAWSRPTARQGRVTRPTPIPGGRYDKRRTGRRLPVGTTTRRVRLMEVHLTDTGESTRTVEIPIHYITAPQFAFTHASNAVFPQKTYRLDALYSSPNHKRKHRGPVGGFNPFRFVPTSQGMTAEEESVRQDVEALVQCRKYHIPDVEVAGLYKGILSAGVAERVLNYPVGGEDEAPSPKSVSEAEPGFAKQVSLSVLTQDIKTEESPMLKNVTVEIVTAEEADLALDNLERKFSGGGSFEATARPAAEEV